MEIDVTIEKKINEFKLKKMENERLISTCKDMINHYKEKIFEYENSNINLEEGLKKELFEIIPQNSMKESKTQLSYKVPSGTFIKKFPKDVLKLKEKYNESEIPEHFIKVTRSVDWINFKKNLIIENDLVINIDTGEIVECCNIEKKPEQFVLKI